MIAKDFFKMIVCRSSDRSYHIAGNFRWCKFSYIWPKSPQNKFLYVLISYARATRPHPCSSPMAYSTEWWSLSPGLAMSVLALASIWLIISLWVSCSKIWQNNSCLYSTFNTCGQVKVWFTQIFFNCSNFIFVCRISIRNIRKLAPYKNFPLYGTSSFA